MTRKQKLSHHGRTLLRYPRLRVGLISAFIIMFVIVGSRLVFLSLAAPSSYSRGSNPNGDDSLPSDLPPIEPDPTLTQACSGGIDISIAVDVSGDQSPLAQFRQPLTDFVSSLLPSPNTEISLTEFSGTTGSVVQPLTGNAGALDQAISTVGTSRTRGGDTDWATGLQDGYSALSIAPSTLPRLLIIASDSMTVDPDQTTAITNAVNEANTIKAAGIHILAAGMETEHPAPTQALEAISGPNLNTGGLNADVLTLASYQDLDASLLNLAQATCGGSGSGPSGAGTGDSGTGSGDSGAGQGSSGTGSGGAAQAQPTPQASPNPAPTPTPSPQPNPTPSPIPEGAHIQPPQQTPSPFLDGQLFSRGSMPDNYTAASTHRTTSPWWYALAAALVLAVVGLVIWLRRRTRPPSRRSP